MNKIWTLIRKDCRVFRAPIIAVAFMLILPHLITLYDRWATYANPMGPSYFDRTLAGYAEVGLFMATIMCAVFGGAAFALERADRSAQFLAMLPVTREQIVVSKMIVTLGVLVAMVAINLLTLYLTERQHPPFWLIDERPVAVFLASQPLLFGLAWLLSTRLRSATIAASIALGAAFASPFIFTSYMPAGFMWIHVGLGALAWVIGTVVYVRSVEP